MTLPLPTLALTTGFHTATYPAGATFGPRRLTSFEFVWMQEGNALYRRNEETVEAPEGSFVLCRPEATDFFRWDPQRRTRHAYFHFLLPEPLPVEWPAPDRWPVVRFPSGSGDLMPVLFQHLLTRGETDRVSAHTHLLALTLLSAFVTGQTTPETTGDASPPLPEPVRVVQTWLVSRLEGETQTTSPTLTEMARVAAVTPEHLCRLFKAATGLSPMETVRRARLERARTLLMRTNYSIAEIAALCGFESPFHFSRRFKATFGVAPSAIRSPHREAL